MYVDAVKVLCALFQWIQLPVLYTLFHIHTEYYSRDSAVGIATGTDWTTKGSVVESRWGQESSLLNVVQTGSEVHPVS
jgi:hypothetical protein